MRWGGKPCGIVTSAMNATPVSSIGAASVIVAIVGPPVGDGSGPVAGSGSVSMVPALHVAAGEDAGDIVQHVGRRVLVVAVVADQPLLDDVDLLLRVLVDHAGDQARKLDRVLLVLEQLQLQRLLESLVGLVVELLAVERQGAD